MPIKIHRVVLVVDHDDIGADEIRTIIENQRYPNRCIGPVVMVTDTREIDWNDDHPLNTRSQRDAAFATLFEFPKETR
jgi:hypothetical protein